MSPNGSYRSKRRHENEINKSSMARIYDNIETKFAEGLQGIITNAGVKRVDFCVVKLTMNSGVL